MQGMCVALACEALCMMCLQPLLLHACGRQVVVSGPGVLGCNQHAHAGNADNWVMLGGDRTRM
jgi:hypothetical protein